MSSSALAGKGKEEKSKPNENPEENKKWAIPVDISSPCDDFYKRIPNPAFKVGSPLILQLAWIYGNELLFFFHKLIKKAS